VWREGRQARETEEGRGMGRGGEGRKERGNYLVSVVDELLLWRVSTAWRRFVLPSL
jgi:hypothetical protein